MQLELTEYLNGAVARLMAHVMGTVLKDPRELKFLMGAKKNIEAAAKKREAYKEKGVQIPPFLIASIADSCNLACAGCYARADGACTGQPGKRRMAPGDWGRVFEEAAAIGVSFILLAGGEPMLEWETVKRAAAQKDILFPVFTNGTLIGRHLPLFKKHRNLIPVFSIEGDEQKTDGRRGNGIYKKVFDAMALLKQEGLLFGCSVTVTSDNMDEVTAAPFLRSMEAGGCHLCFYVEYVPVEEGTESLALDEAARVRFEGLLENAKRQAKDVVFLAFPGDEKLLGGCLAAGRGFFHISPYGDAEPCPFAPIAAADLHTASLLDVIDSDFFRAVQRLEGESPGIQQGGCALYHRKDEIRRFAGKDRAK